MVIKQYLGLTPGLYSPGHKVWSEGEPISKQVQREYFFQYIYDVGDGRTFYWVARYHVKSRVLCLGGGFRRGKTQKTEAHTSEHPL